MFNLFRPPDKGKNIKGIKWVIEKGARTSDLPGRDGEKMRERELRTPNWL